MKIIGSIEYSEDEREVFHRALAGYKTTLEDPPRHKREEADHPVRRFHERIVTHAEPLDREALLELGDVLRRLIGQWEPETTATAWRELGAPGGDDAVEGLARERREAIARAVDASSLVTAALLRLASIDALQERVVTLAV